MCRCCQLKLNISSRFIKFMYVVPKKSYLQVLLLKGPNFSATEPNPNIIIETKDFRFRLRSCEELDHHLTSFLFLRSTLLLPLKHKELETSIESSISPKLTSVKAFKSTNIFQRMDFSMYG
ncbi:hypothetical protein ACKWTF_009487 [Chironomus riparius]